MSGGWFGYAYVLLACFVLGGGGAVCIGGLYALAYFQKKRGLEPRGRVEAVDTPPPAP